MNPCCEDAIDKGKLIPGPYKATCPVCGTDHMMTLVFLAEIGVRYEHGKGLKEERPTKQTWRGLRKFKKGCNNGRI